MTQEALKLALDALENHTAIKHPQQIHYRDKAITAIKEALAKEKDGTYGYAANLAKTIWQKHYMKESPKFALLDTTEGVLTQIDNMTCGLVREKPPQRTEQPKVRTGDCLLAGVCASEGHKIQPQRTWVGLTDDEIAQGWKESWVTEQAFQSAVWWAEAKLKQKNGYAEENT